MKSLKAFAVALATVLMATAAHAGTSIDSVEAPRGQSVEAPRNSTDDVEAPSSLEAR